MFGVIVARFLIIALILYPLVAVLIKNGISYQYSIPELIWVLKNTFVQAFFSSMVSLVLGIFVSWGLLGFKGFQRRALEAIYLIPSFIPALLIALSVMNFLEPFPFGLVGIIIIHSIMNIGLVGVILAKSAESKLSQFNLISEIMGASRGLFLRKIYLPLLKVDFLYVFILVFSFCITSFSTPLLVGGNYGTTLEVLIYEKIRVYSDWSSAVFLAIIQYALIFCFGFLNKFLVLQKANSINEKMTLLQNPFSLSFYLILFGFLFFGFFQGLLDFKSYGQFNLITPELPGLLFGSFLYSSLVYFFVMLILAIVAFSYYQGNFKKIYYYLNSPSVVLLSISFLFFGLHGQFDIFILMAITFSMLIFMGLIRMGLLSELDSLVSQFETATIIGSSPWLTFKKVIFPQVYSKLHLLSSIAAIWAIGDFSVGRILSFKNTHLAMLIQNLMAGYRLGLATLLSVFLILISVFMYILLQGLDYVIRRKFKF